MFDGDIFLVELERSFNFCPLESFQVLAIGAIVACMLGTVIGGDSNVKYVPPTIYKVGNFMTISHKGFVKPHLSKDHSRIITSKWADNFHQST